MLIPRFLQRGLDGKLLQIAASLVLLVKGSRVCIPISVTSITITTNDSPQDHKDQSGFEGLFSC